MFGRSEAPITGGRWILHWNGTMWSIGPSPRVGTLNGGFGDISAVSPNDIWATGSFETRSGSKPLAAHWNGRTWRNVHVRFDGFFESVSAVDSHRAWAVGAFIVGQWDGRRWRQVDFPMLGDVISVSAATRDDAWVVGNYRPGIQKQRVYSDHWDGSRWSLVRMRNPGGRNYNDEVYDVGSLPSSAWAVGTYESPEAGLSPLIEHIC